MRRVGQINLFTKRVAAKPPPAPEFHLQCAVADVLRRWADPAWLWSALPFGEERPAEFRNGVRVSWAGERLKRAGVKPGFPDFLFLAPQARGPFFLELKRKGRGLSEHQAGFALWCKLNGYPFEVADSLERALAVLREWGAVRTGVNIQ